MNEFNRYQDENLQRVDDSAFNPYQSSQTEQLQLPQGLPNWLVKSWLNTKQFIEEPMPPVVTWSGAVGQIYRWIVLFHVCNLLPVLALWKLCHRWRTFTLVFVLGVLITAGIAFAGYSIMAFVSEHVTWTIK